MAVVTVKSVQIINWDASPIFTPTTGEGNEGMQRINTSDNIGVTSGDSSGSIYRFLRIPVNAKIKRLFTTVVGNTGTVSVDIDVAFSDSLTDGTQAAFNSLANPAVLITAGADNKLFGAAIAITGTAAIVKTERTFAGTFTPVHQNLPIWQVLVALGATQFVADPGGFFDLIFKVTTAAATANTTHSMEVEYVV